MKTVHEIVSDLIQRVILADESGNYEEKLHLFLEFTTYYDSASNKRAIQSEVDKILAPCSDKELSDFFYGAMV